MPQLVKVRMNHEVKTLLSSVAIGTAGTSTSDVFTLDHAREFQVFYKAIFKTGITAGVKCHVRASHDGTNFQDFDWAYGEIAAASQSTKIDVVRCAAPPFARVLLENVDAAKGLTGGEVVGVRVITCNEDD